MKESLVKTSVCEKDYNVPTETNRLIAEKLLQKTEYKRRLKTIDF